MHNITIDFNNPGLPQVIDVMQSDAQSRFIGLTLYDGGVPYSAPSGAVYTVEYHGQGANNTGWYDTIQLPSGTRKAVVVSSSSPNVVTLELAEQALRVNGKVEVSLCVVNNTGYKLNTFPIICRVTGAPYVDPVSVRSYFYVTGLTSEQWLAYVTACQDAQKRAEDAAAKFVTDPTLSVSGKAADAAKVGEAVSAESERAKAAEEENAKGVSQLKEDLDSSLLSKYTLNTKFIDGKYIDGTGALVDYEGWRTSDFITINKNICMLSFENTNIQYNYNNAFYDENYQFAGAFIANKLVRVPKKARYLRCSFENNVFDKVYFTSSTYNDYLSLLCNTLYIQSRIKISEYDKNFTYSVIFEPFNNTILGYYKEPYSSSEKYITVGTAEGAVNGKYTINIPVYSALVLDATKFATNTSNIVEVKGYNDITENDLVLFNNNCSSQAKQYQKGGILYNEFYYIQKENNDDVMKSVCRFGISYGQPESPDSVVAAKKAGYNYYRCNLQCTKDGIFVLWHDPALNQYYKNVYDGNSLVPYSATDKIVIGETNLSALNKYKYGSTDYNAGIPTLENLLKSCRINGMKLYLESKMSFTSEQIASLYTLISRYGMTNKTSIVMSKSNAEMLAKIDKSIRVGVDYAEFSEDVKNTFIELTGLFDNVFWWGWTTMALTKDIVDFLSKHNIEFECGDFGSYESIDIYLSADYAWYCSGMELEGSMSPLISNYLKTN